MTIVASGVGARLDLSSIPRHPAAAEDEALGGGEDYELLATLPDDEAVVRARSRLHEDFGVPLTRIGGIIDGEGLVAVGPGGDERPLAPSGWDHLR